MLLVLYLKSSTDEMKTKTMPLYNYMTKEFLLVLKSLYE